MELMNKRDIFKQLVDWPDMKPITKDFQCGYCGKSAAGGKGVQASVFKYSIESLLQNDEYKIISPSEARRPPIGVYICPDCHKPTFIDEIIYKTQFPLPKRVNDFHHIPSEVNKVYQEAIDSYSAGAFTGTTLLCRKLLMNIAVNLGAKENQNFAEYVQYLHDDGRIADKSHDWVDMIRTIGNKATHDLDVSTQEEAENVLTFCEMLLNTNYEYPSKVFNKKEDLESNK